MTVCQKLASRSLGSPSSASGFRDRTPSVLRQFARNLADSTVQFVSIGQRFFSTGPIVRRPPMRQLSINDNGEGIE
jgi:hypothetical protein